MRSRRRRSISRHFGVDCRVVYQTVGLLAHQEGHSSHPLTYKCPLSSQIALTLTLSQCPFPGHSAHLSLLITNQIAQISTPDITIHLTLYFNHPRFVEDVHHHLYCIHRSTVSTPREFYSGFVPRLPSKLRLLLRSRSRRESGISCSSSPESSARRCISSKDDPAGAADGAKSAEGAPAGASK